MFDLFNVFTNKGLPGFIAGSGVLALILYQDTLKNFVYSKDSNGDAILVNKGNSRSANNGLLYTGRGLELGATNDLPIAIAHTLGSEEKNIGNYGLGTDWINNGDGTYTATDATSWLSIITLNPHSINLYYEIEILSISAGSILGLCEGIELLADEFSTIGIHIGTYSFPSTTTQTYIKGVGFTGTIKVNTIREITNPDSFLTIVHGDGSVEQVGNNVDGGSSKEEVVNGIFDTDTDWSKGTGWSIGGGSANIDGSQVSGSNLFQDLDIKASRTYIVEWEQSGDFVAVYLGSLANGILNTDSDGIYSITTTADTDGGVYFRCGASAVTSVDNISVKEILPTSTHYTFNNQTILEVMPTTAPFTTADLALIQADTTLLARLALGEDNAGGLSLVTEDVHSWQPLTENEGAYVIDAASGYIDSTDFVNQEFTTNLTGWNVYEGSTMVWQAGGKVLVDRNGSPSEFNTLWQRGTTTIGKYYVYEIKVDSLSHTASFVSEFIITGDLTIGINTFMSKARAINEKAEIRVGETIDTTATVLIDYIKVREATAEEITNYIASIRENIDQNQKGLQTTCLILDSLGVPISVDFTKLHWYNDSSYSDTQWIPSGDWIMETAFRIEANESRYFGSSITNFRVGETTDYKCRIVMNGIHTLVTLEKGIYAFVTMSSSGHIYVNGVEQVPTDMTGFNETLSFTLGVVNDDRTNLQYKMISPIAYFKVIDNETQIAEYDALQAYNDWAGI